MNFVPPIIYITVPLIIWLVVGITAMSINLWGLYDAKIDLDSLPVNSDKLLIVVGNRNISREALRVISQFFFLFGGFVTIFMSPSGPPNPIVSGIFTVCFIIAQGLVCVNGILDRRSRHAIRQKSNQSK